MSPNPPAPIAPAIAEELIIVTIVTVKPATIPGPLTIAAIPFFARIAEVSLREVDQGLIEAAQAMGHNLYPQSSE
jgi:ABC-type methionine transport system permease subunit